MLGICGANCSECGKYKNNECRGCQATNGKPFGKKCFIANYISIGGIEGLEELKKQLIEEINNLKIEGMPLLKELYPLNGSIVNLEYILPNGKKEKLLQDDEIYLGYQLECLWNDNEMKKYYGIVANMSFIMISEYGENTSSPELIIYKRR